jgi:hypothetical protein
MKKAILFLILICATSILISKAQNNPDQTILVVTEVDDVNLDKDTTKTLFHCSKRDKDSYKQQYIGFYGEMNYQYAQFRTDFTSISGGSFMVVFNKRFAIGATMQQNSDQTFSPNFVNPSYPAVSREYLHAGFGGIKMEYTCMPNSLVHLSFPWVIGYGWASVDQSEHMYSGNHYKDMGSTNAFYVIQPGAQLELNVFRFLKLYAGVNYRFSTTADVTNTLPANTLMGFGTVGGVKIGLFYLPLRKK